MKSSVIALAFATIFFAACSNNAKVNTQAQNTTRDSLKMMEYSMRAMRDSLRIDSFQRAAAVEKQRVAQQQASAVSSRTAYASSPARRTYVKGVSESHYYTQPQVQKKKGWSSAAKGAVIGAGAGAVTGILVDKKDARGAVIGGVLGAGTGYVIGRAHDRKTGRVQ